MSSVYNVDTLVWLCWSVRFVSDFFRAFVSMVYVVFFV